MPEPTLYLFDGYNLLHAGDFRRVQELIDQLASFVALKGARGVVVFDGVGLDAQLGPLEIRYASHADVLLERLAADNRRLERVCLVSSDAAVRGTAGQEVRKQSSQIFVAELEPHPVSRRDGSKLADGLDEDTRARLERLRRGQK